jgi:hypothetical protein
VPAYSPTHLLKDSKAEGVTQILAKTKWVEAAPLQTSVTVASHNHKDPLPMCGSAQTRYFFGVSSNLKRSLTNRTTLLRSVSYSLRGLDLHQMILFVPLGADVQIGVVGAAIK